MFSSSNLMCKKTILINNIDWEHRPFVAVIPA